MKVLSAVLLFLLFFVSATFAHSVHAVTYVDTTPGCIMYAWDQAAGRGAPETTGGEPTCAAHKQAQQICETSGIINGESINKFNLNSSITGIIAGINPEMVSLCTVEEEPELIAIKQGTVIGTTDTLIAGMYQNPPASGVDYVAYVAQNAGLVPAAYAQGTGGIGGSGLSPLLPIWTVFRNIAYLLVVVIFVVIGFMIMFRMKLDPQTVITVQSAIPNVIVALILITFSYAIAGLMIDLMYVVINIIISVFVDNGLLEGVELNTGLGWRYSSETATELIATVNSSNAGTLFNALYEGETIGGLTEAWWEAGQTSVENTGIPRTFGLQAATAAIWGGLGWIGGAIIGLLIAMALMFVFVRIFFILLLSYIQIILLILIAPFYLLAGAIPGRNTFRNWLFALIGNLSVFPTTIAVLLLGLSIGAQVSALENAQIWGPPLLLGPTNGSAVWVALINFGLIMLTPQIISTVKGLFAPKPVLPIGPGQLFSPITGGIQTIGNIGQQRYYLRGLPFIGKKIGGEG